LHSDGTDRTLIDPSNVNLIQTQIVAYAGGAALGGDLNGIVSNGHVNGLTVSGTYNWTLGGAFSATGAINGASLGTGGTVTATGNISGNDIYANRGNGTGYMFFGGSNYLGWDGGGFQFSPATLRSISVAGNCTVTGSLAGSGVSSTNNYYYFASGTSDTHLINSGGWLYVRSPNGLLLQNVAGNAWSQLQCATILLGPTITLAYNSGYPAMTVNSGLQITGYFAVEGTTVGPFGITIPNSANNAGAGYANSWINASSASFKKNVKPIANPLGILLNPDLRGIEYDHEWENAAIEGVREALSGTTHCVGFVADDWYPHVPEIVALDNKNEVVGMDYSRVTALLWEALREYVTTTNSRLERLESK
jgi:hypothetical protein